MPFPTGQGQRDGHAGKKAGRAAWAVMRAAGNMAGRGLGAGLVVRIEHLLVIARSGSHEGIISVFIPLVQRAQAGQIRFRYRFRGGRGGDGSAAELPEEPGTALQPEKATQTTGTSSSAARRTAHGMVWLNVFSWGRPPLWRNIPAVSGGILRGERCCRHPQPLPAAGHAKVKLGTDAVAYRAGLVQLQGQRFPIGDRIPA